MMNKASETGPSKTEENIRYFKLLFIKEFSKYTENNNVKIVFRTFKLASLFSTKYEFPFRLKPYVIYKFFCASCYASQVGETYKHISTRTREHLETDKSCTIFKEVKNSQCKSICNENCLSILDSARTKYTFKLKEGMYINQLKSSLNKQVKLILPSILVHEKRFSILVCSSILFNLDISMCYNRFYTLRFFNYYIIVY